MPWSEIRVESWSELVATFDGTTGDISWTSYWYRGQSNSEWRLDPSLLRTTGRRPLAAIFKAEEETIRRFQAEAGGYVPPNYLMGNDDVTGWLCLMQHYRAPTRLLDWTSSPYVAAYFAVVENFRSDGVVWRINPQYVNTHMDGRFGAFPIEEIKRLDQLQDPDGKPRIIAFNRPRQTDRMVAQQGAFTLCTLPNVDHSELMLEGTGLIGGMNCIKILIPSQIKKDVLGRLRWMNISASSLFPGIDGVGRSIAEQVQLALRGGV